MFGLWTFFMSLRYFSFTGDMSSPIAGSGH